MSEDNYDDIINLPHPVSRKHQRMPMEARAAQFAPFAALTGHGAAIEETARLTDAKLELGAEELAVLNRKMDHLKTLVAQQPEVTITYFQPDDRKADGSYLAVTQPLRKIDDYDHQLVLSSGLSIPIDDVLDIESPLLKEIE